MAKVKRKRKQSAKEPESIFEKDINLDLAKSNAETFVEENKGKILGILGLFLAVVLAYMIFTRVYIPNQEKSAQAEMYAAEQLFNNGEFQQALDGTDSQSGFLDIIDSYSGWARPANLANYYAGISYLNLGQFDEAIEFLGNYSGKDKIISAMAQGAMGDAYTEKGENATGIGYYEKAAAYDNEFTAPLFLLKAGLASEINSDIDGAKRAFERIKRDYPESTQARDVEKYLARLGAKAAL